MRTCTMDYYRTGGHSSRDHAVVASDRRWLFACPVGPHDWFAGGPIDAPDILPAGGMDSTSTVDGRGQPIAAEQSCRRATL